MKTNLARLNPLAFPLTLALAAALSSPDALAADRSASVTGHCSRQVGADRGAITLTAEFTDRDLKVASRKAMDSYSRLRDAVQKLKLADLDVRTSEYQVQEIREWEKNRTVSKGFRARMGIRVASSDVQRLGEVIEIGSKEGAKDVGQLETFLSDEKRKSEQFACLQAAAENARAKAEKLASSLKASVGEVTSIVESAANDPSPIQPMRENMMAKSMMADSAPPAVEGGKMEISTSIQATFKLN